MLQRQQREARSRLGWAGAAQILLALAALLFLSVGVAAQEQPLTVELAGLAGDDWPQAVVTVLDGDGRPVAGLAEAHFQAWLNDSAVPVTEVTRGVDSSLGIAVVLALDVSGSMNGDALEQAKAAAHRFLDDLGPRDSVAVIAFADAVVSVLAFTQDRGAAGAAIDGLAAVGATKLYEATAESVRVAAVSDNSRRAVVLLSDGLDNGSTLSRADALAAAETLGVPVFAIGLGADIDRDYLQELAQRSGGRFDETPSPEGLAQLYQEAGELLRGQYVLALDASDLSLVASEAATLRVEVAVGERSGGAERAFCLQRLCVTLGDVEPGERLEAERTIVAQVISADPVVSVTFLVDGEPVRELTDLPYQFTFDPAAFEGGEHTLGARVTTAAGEMTTGEVMVRTDVGGGGVPITLLAIVVILILGAAVAGGGLLFLRRRHGGEEEEPGPAVLSGLPGLPGTSGPSRPLWEEGPPPPPPPEPDEPLGCLRVTSGSLAGQTFPVGGAPVSIGSGNSCLIRLSEESEGEEEIAAEQARVWIRDGQLMVHELRRLTAMGSVGGDWGILAPGDTFAIGPCTFQFELTEGEDAEPAGGPAPPQEVPNILRDFPDGPVQQIAADPSEASAPEERPAQQPDAPPTAERDASQGTVPEFRDVPRPQPEE